MYRYVEKHNRRDDYRCGLQVFAIHHWHMTITRLLWVDLSVALFVRACLCNSSALYIILLPPVSMYSSPAVIRLLQLSKCVLSLSLCLFRFVCQKQAVGGRKDWAITLLSRYQFGLTLRGLRLQSPTDRPYNPSLLFKRLLRAYFAGRAVGSGIYWRGNWRLCLPLWVAGEWCDQTAWVAVVGTLAFRVSHDFVASAAYHRRHLQRPLYRLKNAVEEYGSTADREDQERRSDFHRLH